MSAAENLARWREAEQGATGGPWRTRDDLHSHLYVMGPIYSVADCGFLDDVVNPGIVGGLVDDIRADGDFIATSRTAMPALLAFAEAVLALGHVDCPQDPDRDPYVGCRCGMSRVHRLAEQHLSDGAIS